MRVKRRKEVSLAGSPSFRITLFLLLFFCKISEADAFVEQRCKTVDIRNYPNGRTWPKKDAKKDQSEFPQLDLNCTVLEGSFLMSMVAYTDHDNRTFTREDFPRFEHLREITGSLLIFQVNGLKSLKWVFPNLRVIGGQNLIQHYSLIVYQNDEIEELGLDNLRVIRNGGVRISENSKLCNPKSVNWRHLQFGTINDVLVDDSSEISVGEGKIKPCQKVCTPRDQSRCLQSEKGISCWSTVSCQLGCEHDRNGTQMGPGCSDDTWERCHSECIAGCSRPNDRTACFACAHISHEGQCLPKCPEPLYSYLDRRCVTKDICEGLEPKKSAGQIDTWKAFNGRCHYHCPDEHEEDPKNNKTCRHCGAECIRKCKGNITIDSLSKARTLEKCTVIDGHLEIEMRIGMESVAASEMTKAFGRIEIIDGYLLIRLTPSLVNLNMFKSLHTITGRYLYRDKYAISVYENDNLQKLFPLKPPKFNVTAGYFQFQNNRMLCFDHITDLMKSLDRDKEIDDFDQSKNSNGDKAICSESSFDVLVAAVSSTSFKLQWKAFNTTDMDYRKFLGYEIKYKEVDFPDPNMSIDDDRSACSDSWNNHFLEVKTSVTEHGHVQMDHKNEDGEWVMEDIANELIKPNTYYAFYVTTSMVRHEGATNAVSRIGFLRTHFGIPDPPVLSPDSGEKGTDSIFLIWTPPARPNGEVTHYIVTYKPQMDNKYVEEFGDGCYEDHDSRNEKITEDPTTLSPGQQLLLSTVAPPDTCAAHGCCACAADAKTTSEQRQEAANFENALQDIIFVPKPEELLRVKRSIRPPNQDKDTNNRIEELINKIDKHEALNEPKRINVTGTNITLTGLHHYTDYFISISACQNVSAEASHCSMKKAWKNVKTRGIREADLVDNRTVSAVVYNATGVVNITWKGPKEPNGRVKLYEITVINMDTKTTPHKQCRGYKDGWTPEKGIEFTGLSNGKYHVEIRTKSLLTSMSEPCIFEFFEIAVPGFWTTERIIIWGTITSVFLIIFSIIAYFFFKKYYGKKMIEYATQLISANPEYLSQQDVYKADEWELPRGKLTVEDCIGKGTFGQVFKGYGHQLQTVRNHIFGPCAIKTVTESSNSAERIHFLLEASVMKKFDASYIVKLFGVVSDGQPVFVVMELMDNGNLRDYLRARRPDAEENVNNLPAPTEDEMLRWAIQIADGMAYLESLKFCHRDLAARNCMVSKDLVVKIGDFGMTRDLCYREYYKPAGRRMMPVRWMAPESLLDGKHDIKSDVWSYGVVLYEMWTGGQLPYTGLANEEVIEHIRKGKSLDPPPLTPQTWALLMKECFSHASRERPNFFTIVDELYDLSESKKVDLQGFNELSFVFTHPEMALAESNYGDDDNPYQPDPLSNFINDQFESGEETQREEPVNNRGAQDTPDWEEGVSLRNGILVAEHEV